MQENTKMKRGSSLKMKVAAIQDINEINPLRVNLQIDRISHTVILTENQEKKSYKLTLLLQAFHK